MNQPAPQLARLRAVDDALAACLADDVNDDVVRLAAERDSIVRELVPLLDPEGVRALADASEALTRAVQARRHEAAAALDRLRARRKASRAYREAAR